MGKRVVVLLGHCGADASYLRLAVKKADAAAQIVSASDRSELDEAIKQGAELLLVNRELWGFDVDSGIELIRLLRKEHPELKMMLVSNYPQAQAEAVAAGALPGFGKRELGSGRVIDLLRSAGTEQK